MLVNNAAVFPSGPFVDVTVTELDETMAVNQRAYFLCAQHAARSMIESGGGSIVNIASITWHGGWSNMSPYVATKGGIVAITRALATELGQHEIRVNAVAPGAFPTAAERAQHPDLEEYEAVIFSSQALKRPRHIRRARRRRLVLCRTRVRIRDRSDIECRRRLDHVLVVDLG